MAEEKVDIINPPAAPFNYTNRDYRTLKQSLVNQVRARVPGWSGYNDPNDFGLALIESFTYVADGLHYYLDRIANEAYLRTAVRPESIRAISSLFGYRPSPASNASVDLVFINNTNEPIVVPQGTLVQTSAVDSETLAPIYFETVADHTALVASDTGLPVPVPAIEGITFNGDDGYGEVLGVSDGSPWQIFSLPRAPVLEGFVQTFVSYSETWNSRWNQVEDIRAAAYGESSFQVEYTPQGAALIQFGSSNSGAIPPQGAVIKCLYRIGGGVRGNVDANTLTVISDDISLAGLIVTNPEMARGGADKETLESIRRNASWVGGAATNHAVTLTDFEKISLSHVSVGKSSASSNDPSVVRVAIAPIDDGTVRPGIVDVSLDSSKILPRELAVDPCGNPVPPGATATTRMSDYFTNTVIPSVERSLLDAAFAGAAVQVDPPCYVELFVGITVIHAETAPDTLKAAVRERLRQAMSYRYVDFGMTFRPYDLARMFATMRGVENVIVNRLTRGEHDQTGVSVIKLDPNEIPFIRIDDTVIEFREPSEEDRSVHVVKQSQVSPQGFTTFTDLPHPAVS